jgi:3-oxoacyl-[acyl-carrier-protein] synthase-1
MNNISAANIHLPKRRVVVTGMGIISSLGLNRDQVTDSLRESKSGIQLLPERKERGFRSGLSGVVSDFSSSGLERRYRKTLPEFGLWAWDAVTQALSQAGVAEESLADDPRSGIIFGNDSSVVTGVEQTELLKEFGDSQLIGSGHLFRLLTSTITLNLATKLRLQGSSWTISGACASGAMAIGQAADLIASGKQERMICGGAQEISWQSMCSFDGIGAFSICEDNPTKASRPFDRERDGLVPSGGAAALFLEERENAIKRKAPILAEICGYATSTDGHHIAVPSGKGLMRAMRRAMDEAGTLPEEIELLMAHATSTPAGDDKEAEAIAAIFQTEKKGAGPMVAAVKSLTGHEFWMAGASQLIYALLMAQNNFISAHPNLNHPIDAAATLDIPTSLRAASPKTILCNAAGFGGTNACLVVRR